MTDTHRLAWAAGIVDGEGSIHLRRDAYGSWELTVAVGNTDPRMLAALKQMFGGSINSGCPKPPRRPMWKWAVTRRKAEACLVEILPWLVVKRDQADLALESRRLITPMRGRKGRRLPAEIHDANAGLARQLRELKVQTFADPWRRDGGI